jgi:thioredoxin
MQILTCQKCGAKNRVDERRAQATQPVCGRCRSKLSLAAAGGDVGGSGGKPIEVTDATFDAAVRQADVPVLVDCWAPWCGPCRMIAPTMDQLAAESNGRYLIAKLNTDENRQVATEYRIDAIPTMLIFHHGQLVDRIVGLLPKQAILARLESAASAAA